MRIIFKGKPKPKQEMTEMARIGIMNNTYEVFVNTDDAGKIPHFHVRDINTRGQQFHTCIKITSAEYFHHEGKMGVFNSKDRKELIKFLNHKDKDEFLSNWEIVIWMWNKNNSDVGVPRDLEMPNYLELK